MFCTSCGSQNEPGTVFCTKCGARLGGAEGSPAGSTPEGTTPEGTTPIEGAPVVDPTQPPQASAYQPPPAGYTAPPYQDPNAKSKLVAGLLGILVGGLGVHRFYLGYNNIGIAQLAIDVIGWILLPFTCGISLIFILAAHLWGIVDGIMILTGSLNTDAQGRPLKD